MQKIQFAAGLRLKRRSNGGNSAPSTIEGPLSPIELAYVERSKALVSMLHKFRCACHNVSFPTIKRLFAHLRMSYTWFPIFTCYNCVITFSTRSLNMRHTGRCPNPYLENSLRLSEMRKRTETKIRLYQYSKCNKCENLYAFYEDYCDHIDKEHATEPPHICVCTRKFETAEDYKQHAYTSCFLSYYCDVCYSVFDSLDDFRAHCEEEHDKIEEFVFVNPNPSFIYCNREEVVSSRKRSHEEMNQSNNVENPSESNDNDGNERKKFIPNRYYSETINCDLCERRFNNHHALRKHMKMHRRTSIANGWKSKPSSCSKCGKVFSTYYNMIRHYKVHDDAEKHLQCALCTDKFRLVSELKDHLILVHGRANVCQECGRQFESVKELEQHRSVHLNIKVYRDSKTQSYRTGTRPRYSCEYCEAVFETEIELNEHSAIHTTEMVNNLDQSDASEEPQEKKVNTNDFGRFSCTDCDRHYVSYKGLWLHNRRHHPERKPAPQTFDCQYCDRVLQTNAAYQMHKQMHERMQERMQKQQQHQSKMAADVNKGDDEEESYFTCKHCFKVFSNKYNLKTHLKTHGIYVSPGRTYSKSGKFVKTFWCDICHQACQGYSELQKHKQEHIKEKLKVAHNRQQMLQNQQMVHHNQQYVDLDEEDVKPQIFSCDICTKGFLTKGQLMAHKTTHEQDARGQKRNFVYCKYCKTPFLNVNGLNRHMEEEHNKMQIPTTNVKNLTKKHACNLCKKVFDTAGALCSHQGWHKRGKSEKQLKSDKLQQQNFQRASAQVKHECTSCNLTFLTDTALQIHILEAHRNVNAHVLPSRCTICNIEFKTQAAYDEHARLHRTTSTTFQCRYCTRKFNKSETFNIHVNEAHPEHADAKFKCHQCERIFEKQNALTIHLKVHDRQRLTGAPIKQPKSHIYTCSICHLGFEIPKDLRNHIITSHPF